MSVPESAFSFAAERRRSKKCSIFDTISENVVTKEAEGYPQAGDINIPKIQKENAKYLLEESCQAQVTSQNATTQNSKSQDPIESLNLTLKTEFGLGQIHAFKTLYAILVFESIHHAIVLT